MTREIKFRAWIGEKMLFEGDRELDRVALTFDGKLVTAADTDLVYLDNNSGRFKIMQFTGLKDKNGKEIYEGDIVKDSIDQRVEIKWIDEECGFKALIMEESLKGMFRHIKDIKTMEVIGNIYEHPELLK